MDFAKSTTDAIERVAREVVDAALKVHKLLGPGLLESVYETCLAYELIQRGLSITRQRKIPIIYEGVKLDANLVLDMIVNECVIVEIKSVDSLHPIHTAQAITYLKLTGKRLCLLINFNVPLINDGIRRVIL